MCVSVLLGFVFIKSGVCITPTWLRQSCVFAGRISALGWALPGLDAGLDGVCSVWMVPSGLSVLRLTFDSIVECAKFSQPSSHQSVAIVVCFSTDS